MNKNVYPKTGKESKLCMREIYSLVSNNFKKFVTANLNYAKSNCSCWYRRTGCWTGDSTLELSRFIYLSLSSIPLIPNLHMDKRDIKKTLTTECHPNVELVYSLFHFILCFYFKFFWQTINYKVIHK